MLADELKRRLEEIQHQIRDLDQKIEPLVLERRRLEDHRQSVLKLLDLEGGASNVASAEVVVPRKPSGDPHWQAICDERAWTVNGNSAHRIVMRNDPTLHKRIGHFCTYDNRTYP